MKRHVILAAFAAIAVCSCSISDASSTLDNELASFSNNLVFDSINQPLLALVDVVKEQKEGVFKDGFTCTRNGVYITLLSASDSTWTAVNAFESDNLKFTTTIKMLPDNALGYHNWKCWGKADYEENYTYKATLETESPAVTYWKDSSSSTSVTYDMVMDAKFIVNTFLRNGSPLDRCTLTYKGADASYPYWGEISYTVESTR